MSCESDGNRRFEWGPVGRVQHDRPSSRPTSSLLDRLTPPQVLSTGRYTLLDVQCRCCRVPIGWRYITADSPDQRYKEGAYLLQQGALKRVGCGERSSGSGSGLSSPGMSSPGLSSPTSGGSPTSGSPLQSSRPLPSPPRALAQLARLRE